MVQNTFQLMQQFTADFGRNPATRNLQQQWNGGAGGHDLGAHQLRHIRCTAPHRCHSGADPAVPACTQRGRQHGARTEKRQPQQHKHHGRKSRNHGKQQAQAPRHQKHPGLGGELPTNRITQVLVMFIVGGTRHQKPCRHGTQQGRNLRHHAIANGQNAVLDGRSRQRHVLLHHPHSQTAQQVDDDDDDACDGIALDELHRAVQAAVELALVLQNAAPTTCLILVNQPRP